MMFSLLVPLLGIILGCKKEKVLVIGFVPSAEVEEIATTTKPLVDILSRKLNMKLKSYLATDYTALVEALGSNKIDIAFLPPFGYILAYEKYKADIILKAIRNGHAYYRSQFVVRKGSAKNLNDLKGKIWAYPDAASTSGYIFPKAYMLKIGIDPDKFFKDRIQTGSHDNAILAVYNNEADLATTFEGAENRLLKEYKDIKDKIEIIAYTDSIPNDGIVVRAGLDTVLREKIKQVFLELNDDKEAMEILKKVYSWDGIVPAKDSDYQVVRETMKLLNIR
ncbi:MAG: phosphate/phosphite/phosphonate ABC transporter substrate-binding protein [candidate division WOR-3 bacterium]|nr:phosphate/phosphite/phosphonate ABC transporter substrate-binding protein [candidate division WOR-3 bacterium]MDW8151025.1 phosphate/phosphite/phosphonate ABC transporter substrate-binding protein [candidate division WOR-3 bacterium]